MQDFDTPFNPLGGAPLLAEAADGTKIKLQPGCCGNVCSPSCIADEERATTSGEDPTDTRNRANDDDVVTIQIPTGHRPLAPDEPGIPIFDLAWVTAENPKGQCGEDRSGVETTTPFTLTVGQLKHLVLSRVFAVGNYADTRAIMAQVRRAFEGNES